MNDHCTGGSNPNRTRVYQLSCFTGRLKLWFASPSDHFSSPFKLVFLRRKKSFLMAGGNLGASTDRIISSSSTWVALIYRPDISAARHHHQFTLHLRPTDDILDSQKGQFLSYFGSLWCWQSSTRIVPTFFLSSISSFVRRLICPTFLWLNVVSDTPLCISLTTLRLS